MRKRFEIQLELGTLLEENTLNIKRRDAKFPSRIIQVE
jgi:hypothetical protein